MTTTAAGPDPATPVVAWRPGRITKTVTRYEVVAAVVGAVVLLTRLAGGSFIGERLGPDLGAITPFAAPAAAAAAAPPGAPAPTAAVDAGPSFAGSAGRVSSSASSSFSASPATGVAESPTARPSMFAAVAAPGSPAGIATSPAGEVWVGTDNTTGAPALFRYSRDGALLRTYRVGGIDQGIRGIVASSSTVYLLAGSPAVVVALDPSSGESKLMATVPDVRPCIAPVVTTDCEAGIVDGSPRLTAMAFDAAGDLFVADAGQGTIWRVARSGGRPTTWLSQFGWASPAGGVGPTGLAFDGAGNLVVVVQGTVTDASGVVYVVTRVAGGGAGAVKELARTDSGSRPVGVALGSSGRVYLPLATSGAVLVLGPDGKVIDRLPRDGTIDTPAGLAFLGTDLLVSVQASKEPGKAHVLRLPVGEPGGEIRRGPR